jgi:hypothetical protein
MGACTSTEKISMNENHINNMVHPSEPKTSDQINEKTLTTQKSQKIIEELLDDPKTLTTSVSISTTEKERRPSIEINRLEHQNSARQINIDNNDDYNLSWSKRRNSEKQKAYFMNYKRDIAHEELKKRISLRSAVHSKCPICGDLGPETSYQYYTFYLIVPNIITKTKCRRCNVHFSFEYVGMVKSLNDAISLILDEEN